MVFFYECSDPKYTVYMGRDKYENEKLIKYGHPEDIWFHVDNLSSAHVYLRLPIGDTIDSIPTQIIEEMCQLVKNNSIEGSKAAQVDVVYTPWSNLKKTADMDAGQIGYHDTKMCRYQRHVKCNRDIVKRLERSKKEQPIDLEQSQQDRKREGENRNRAAVKAAKAQEEVHRLAKEEEKKLKSYQSIFSAENRANAAPQRLQGGKTIEEAKLAEENALW